MYYKLGHLKVNRRRSGRTNISCYTRRLYSYSLYACKLDLLSNLILLILCLKNQHKCSRLLFCAFIHLRCGTCKQSVQLNNNAIFSVVCNIMPESAIHLQSNSIYIMNIFPSMAFCKLSISFSAGGVL